MRSRFGSLTLWSVAALASGIALGLAGHLAGTAPYRQVAAPLQAVGQAWVAVLQLITLPLALALVLSAISNASARSVGGLTLRAALFYAAALLAAGALTVPLVRTMLGGFEVAPDTVRALSESVAVPPAAWSAAAPTAGDWIGSLVPANLFQAAIAGQLFPLLLFVMVFGLAVTRLPDAQRRPLARGFQAFAEAMLVLVRWVLLATPIGVFALGYVLALETGASLAGVLGTYLLVQPGVTLLWLLLLYPLTAVLGGIGMGAFARAVLPAQMIAASTRSSAAALPALVAGGRQHLALPETSTSFLLPLSVSLFRLSVAVQDSVKLVFLAHIYDVTLRPATLAAFVVTVCIFSFSSTGIPNSGGSGALKMVPVFVAAGIPVQGVILLEVVETIPDIFATALNVTGQMSATSVLSRWHPRRGAAPEPA